MQNLLNFKWIERIGGPLFGRSVGVSVRSGLAVVVAGVLGLGGVSATFAQTVTAPGARSVISQAATVQASATAVEVALPAGCVGCVVEAKLRGRGTWVRWRSFTPKSGASSLSFVPPKGFGGAGSLVEAWRASVTVDVAKAEQQGVKRKYPASFYRGTRSFGASAAAGYKSGLRSSGLTSADPSVVYSMAGNVARLATTSADVSKVESNSTATAQAVEADIWKTDGSMVYFFNQLRGLQVVDVSDPSKPVMRARLRLPAVGQDLYLLPEQTPGERLVVLLTRSYEDVSGASTEVVVVRVKETQAEIISRQTVAGSLQDSRMVGPRLYVVSSDWNAFWRYQSARVLLPQVVKSAGGSLDSSVPVQPEGNTTLTEILVGGDGSSQVAGSHTVPGMADSALISAGGTWLAVASSVWWNWGSTQISLYGLSETGATLLTETPITTKGRVYDKFKISYQKDTLMAVTQRWEMSEQVTQLECFDSMGNAVSGLEVKRGENLYATRFAAEKLYIVTAVQHDPLWVVDVADPRNPLMGGHVEVPGFSTYLEPVGEDGRFLFTIGLEFGKVVASLFDVSDPANPVLTPEGRVQVSEEGWGWSEAVWDEKALKVLGEEGLALIPFSGGWWNAGNSFVRLVDINVNDGGSLKLRGRLDHDFVPRRATLTNGVLTSISQKELITASIADRDQPSVLAEVALAWPVNQVLQTGDYLLQIADGSSAFWSNEPASIAVSKVATEDQVEQIVELGSGTVCDASIRGSKLYVLRRTASPGGDYWVRPMVVRAVGADFKEPSATVVEDPGLVLSVYDLSALPEVRLLGSGVAAVSGEELGTLQGGLMWINDTTAAVLTQAQSWNWDRWYPYPVLFSTAEVKGQPVAVASSPAVTRIAAPVLPSLGIVSRRLYTPKPAVVRAFDVTNPGAPTALKPLELSAVKETMVSVSAAGDGLLAYAYGERTNPFRIKGCVRDGEEPVSAMHRLGVVDFSTAAAPVVRAPIQVPGRVFAITDLARDGFLVYTETIPTASTIASASREVQVSVVDGTQAILVARTPVGVGAVLSAEGRSLYAADGDLIRRLTVQDSASFVELARATVPWAPAEIQMRGLTLLGVQGNNLMRVSWAGALPSVESWKMRQWFGLSKMTIGMDRTIFAPMGDFGVERFSPQ